MAHAPAAPTGHEHTEHAPRSAVTAVHHPPVSPGKVAMWLFLATEVMFFTGLIGSYIVLRAGTPPTAYTNFYPPGTPLTPTMEEARGVHLADPGPNREQVAEILQKANGGSLHEAEHTVAMAPLDVVLGVSPARAAQVRDQLVAAGAKAEVDPLHTYNWPKPYDSNTNPLSIDLTAGNTFILICSSVTMVLALSAIQRGDRGKGTLFLLLTVLIGSTFLGVQIYEYYQLMFGHHYLPGISVTGHFRPSVSLFASCFFVMTGFHGAHVAGGVVMLTCLLIGQLMGRFTPNHHSPVELIGLYWHFVDLVWIILFTVVYLI